MQVGALVVNEVEWLQKPEHAPLSAVLSSFQITEPRLLSPVHQPAHVPSPLGVLRLSGHSIRPICFVCLGLPH